MSETTGGDSEAPNRFGLAGERVGHYEVQELLGTGGFASVYRAHDPRLRSDVALKVLADNHALNPDIRERFVSEGHLLRRIENPAGLEVYDIGETDRGNPYLVLQLADRGDLEGRVRQLRSTGWTPGPDDVRALVSMLADALEAFHDHDVVHRDVKPSNLLISSSRRAVDRGDCSMIKTNERLLLADLGLAKDLAAASGLTVSGGSVGFAAREQVQPGSIVDERADVFAASAVVAWLLSGQIPERESGWIDACEDRFASIVPLLEHGLADHREDRPAGIRIWAQQLDNALDTVGAPPTPAPTNASLPAQPPPVTPEPAAPVSAPPMPSADRQVTSTDPNATSPASTPSAERSVPVVSIAFAGLAALVMVVGVAWWFTRGAEVTILEDGRSQVEAVEGNASIAIAGPGTIDVGMAAQYEVELSGIESWVIVGPDGVRHADVVAIEVDASGAGSASIQLEATTPTGETIDVELPINVVEP